MLDRESRARLRTLSKENAEVVGRHLVMAGRLLDVDPERAYEHAQAAVRRGGRVDVVREAAGLTAYRTGRHAEALRELRTVRRLSGSAEHLAVMADCERGLGRPERAVALAADPDAADLPLDAAVELAIVVSGARLDLGQPDAALAALGSQQVRQASGLLAARVAQARATALEAAGRPDEAARELAAYSTDDLEEAAGNVPVDEEVVVFDLTDEEDSERDVSGETSTEQEEDVSEVDVPGEAEVPDEVATSGPDAEADAPGETGAESGT
ncbi:MAG: hypothetical protein FWD18_07320 [Micrococcales bacterium]|nr:hypothetical protein [Micrococcales bacterium]